MSMNSVLFIINSEHGHDKVLSIENNDMNI